ncbi:unnamed protein product [Prorocentrum cordatum]|uniref:Uncharacterized protein n=1 Tax=Prorocentrum cordatum TaxID=2364126 RepID=A0ABN9RQ02_9DINO|nr:unnamed protein product [Polarella glacialis]
MWRGEKRGYLEGEEGGESTMGGGRRGMTTPQVIASSWEPGQTIIRGLAGRQTSCAKVNTAPSVRLTSLGNELTTCMRICLQRDAATNSMPPRQRQARQKRPGKIQGEELEMTVDCYHPVSLPSRPSSVFHTPAPRIPQICVQVYTLDALTAGAEDPSTLLAN